jgi:hypothetical protein
MDRGRSIDLLFGGMMLTGKAKEVFEEWLEISWVKFEDDGAGFYMKYIDMFYQTPPSMQYGVYVDWFDSVGVNILEGSVEIDKDGNKFVILICSEGDNISKGKVYTALPRAKTRHEARTKAIEKANEIYNERS